MASKPVKYSDAVLIPLARDIVQNVRDLSDILKELGLSPQDFERIRAMRHFQKIVGEYAVAWHDLANVEERVRLKSRYMAEIGLETLWDIFSSTVTPAAARIEAYKTIVRNAAFTSQVNADLTDKISINITIGKNSIKIDEQSNPKIIDVTPDKKNNKNGDDQL